MQERKAQYCTNRDQEIKKCLDGSIKYNHTSSINQFWSFLALVEHLKFSWIIAERSYPTLHMGCSLKCIVRSCITRI